MITLLKLGGSLITDKTRAHTARPELIRRLASEIREAWESERSPLIIGHGSGSFGHMPAKRYVTRSGVHTEEEWAGFAEVHSEATALNRIVTDILREAELPILSFVPMDCIRSRNGRVIPGGTEMIIDSLSRHLIPMVFGDTVFDESIGGTILSTEDIFIHLCSILREPPRILLAGLEAGVWKDYPQNKELIRIIHADHSESDSFIQESEFTDVTGGMREKVHLMENLIRTRKASSVRIFSGFLEGNLRNALSGIPTGTEIIP